MRVFMANVRKSIINKKSVEPLAFQDSTDKNIWMM